MFEVNKVLAPARANVTVRPIKMGYTEKGNLTDVMGENTCAEDLFIYAQTVVAAVQKLDLARRRKVLQAAREAVFSIGGKAFSIKH